MIMSLVLREDDYDLWAKHHSAVLTLLYTCREFCDFIRDRADWGWLLAVLTAASSGSWQQHVVT